MKKYTRVGTAILCGVLIVALAFYMRSRSPLDPDAGVVILDAPPRQYVEVVDEDKNGVPDWEDELMKNVIASVSTTSVLGKSTEPYTPPTTLTGKFAEAFMKDYLVRKGSGETFEDPTEFVNSAVESINQNTQSKTYTQQDIVVTDSSLQNLRDYGNRIMEIINAHPTQERINEGIIVQRALQKNDPAILDQLVPIREGYEAMLRDTLSTQVPESLTKEHIALLNAYEAILTDIKAMQGMFEDPLYGLARVQNYQQDAANLFYALQNIALGLAGQGIVYTDDEPGEFLQRLSAP